MLAFVTVGTTKFDALVRTLDSQECMAALRARGVTRVLMQIGHGKHEPRHDVPGVEGLVVDFYRHNAQYKQDVAAADLIISHAGAGSVMDALSARKKLVVVVNTALMDNHQTELAEAMADQQYCVHTTTGGLLETLRTVDLDKLEPYPEPDDDAFPALVDCVVLGSKSE